MGFEPTTSTLARLRSTPELYPHRFAWLFLTYLFFIASKKTTFLANYIYLIVFSYVFLYFRP